LASLLTSSRFAFTFFLITIVAITPASTASVAVDAHFAEPVAERQPDTRVVEVVAGTLRQDGRRQFGALSKGVIEDILSRQTQATFLVVKFLTGSNAVEIHTTLVPLQLNLPTPATGEDLKGEAIG
jgi:hypothetical protein